MTNGNKSGTKHDGGKPILGAIPPNAELAIGRVLEFGARKYDRDNWRKVDDLQTRYMDAALRHLNAVRRGEALDEESGEHHLAHAACCVLFMLEDALFNTAAAQDDDGPDSEIDKALRVIKKHQGDAPFVPAVDHVNCRCSIVEGLSLESLLLAVDARKKGQDI